MQMSIVGAAKWLKGNGGASRARTDGLVVANDALSQLSYSPTRIGFVFLPAHFTSVSSFAPNVGRHTRKKLPQKCLDERPLGASNLT